jgi:RNA polymerase sigma factor (sigma-70 family)
MAKLSPDYRELLYLFIVDRFSTQEIAQILGIRSGAVRVRLTRARRRFQQALGVDR